MQVDLVVRASGGDHVAFATLAESAYAGLIRTARLILRDDEEAADAVQEGLMAAWMHIRAVREPERFYAWLQRLAVGCCTPRSTKTGTSGLWTINVDGTGPTLLVPGARFADWQPVP